MIDKIKRYIDGKSTLRNYEKLTTALQELISEDVMSGEDWILFDILSIDGILVSIVVGDKKIHVCAITMEREILGDIKQNYYKGIIGI